MEEQLDHHNEDYDCESCDRTFPELPRNLLVIRSIINDPPSNDDPCCTTMIHRTQHPSCKDTHIEEPSLRSYQVELGICDCNLIWDINVKAKNKKNVPGREEDIVIDRQVLWESNIALIS